MGHLFGSAALLLAATVLAGAAMPGLVEARGVAEGSRPPRLQALGDAPTVVAQNEPFGLPAAPFAAPPPAFGGRFGAVPPPLLPPPVAAPPRCPLVIAVGRGLARPARSRVIVGRPNCI